MEDWQIIDAMGGGAQVAGICELTPQAVSQWRTANRIPKPWRKYLALLRPDLFDGEAAKQQAA